MYTQPFTNYFPNTISISRVRQDIDALTGLLARYPKVSVLKGQDVLFDVVSPESEEEINQKKIRAAKFILETATINGKTKNKQTLTKILISERDKMRSGNYEL